MHLILEGWQYFGEINICFHKGVEYSRSMLKWFVQKGCNSILYTVTFCLLVWLVQIMAFFLVGAQPFSEPMQKCCSFELWEQTSVKSWDVHTNDQSKVHAKGQGQRSHLFDYVPIIVSSWNFQKLLPMTNLTSMQKVKVKGQGHRVHNPT